MREVSGQLSIYSGFETIATDGFCSIRDITQVVHKYLLASKITEGQALVSVPGATGAVTTVEYEPGLLKDLPAFFEKIIPSDVSYEHDQTWHDGNGFSHLRASLMKPSLVIGVTQGELVLGTWQQIILLDFDNRSRQRKYFIQISGIRD